ncbi:hypothetical protein [Streptomyces melanogenes]|uniref:hypothetical protein n=1 Tax=Streptomyces melanogenes TaxID=67326 RepID=UPI00167D39AD|nr:hypothetical protein [Streptomyces melanogenes]GGP89553.1 hypothetical protein GCM10010278_80070 [Streptomyces melanogenes]
MTDEHLSGNEVPARTDIPLTDGQRHRNAEISRLRHYRPDRPPTEADAAAIAALTTDWERDGLGSMEWP